MDDRNLVSNFRLLCGDRVFPIMERSEKGCLVDDLNLVFEKYNFYFLTWSMNVHPKLIMR